LYAGEVESLAPIEAVFLLGGDEIGAWLSKNNWDR
jgi:hypothetical protein